MVEAQQLAHIVLVSCKAKLKPNADYRLKASNVNVMLQVHIPEMSKKFFVYLALLLNASCYLKTVLKGMWVFFPPL